MGFKCGIVGLPNVGKSTLFNALTATVAAQAAKYPFSTIEANIGEVAGPDTRLPAPAGATKSGQIWTPRPSLLGTPRPRRWAPRRHGAGEQLLPRITRGGGPL